MRRQILIASLLSLGLLGANACTADDTPDTSGDTDTTMTVTGTDALRFTPDAYTVPVGEEITVTFTAEATVEHDLVIAGAAAVGMTGDDGHGAHGDDDVTDEGDLHVAHADAGETVTATFTLNETGVYTVYCSVPGHQESGMVATLTVAAR